MKIWHDHSTVEGHSTLLVSVAFTYNININRTPSSSSDLSESEQAKIIKQSVFRFMIPKRMATKRREVLQRISPGEYVGHSLLFFNYELCT